VDLPLFDRNQGSIALEKATRQQLFDEFINRVFEARNDIAVCVAEIESLNRQIAFAESAVPVLERLVADYEKAVNVGNADVLSYYTVRNDLDKKKIEIVKLRQERIDGWIALENAAGMYLPAAPADGSDRSVSPEGSQGVSQ
jgi:outer membrane protein TolC